MKQAKFKIKRKFMETPLGTQASVDLRLHELVERNNEFCEIIESKKPGYVETIEINISERRTIEKTILKNIKDETLKNMKNGFKLKKIKLLN